MNANLESFMESWTGIPADTHPEAARMQFEILRRIGPEGRARLTIRMSQDMLAVAASGVRSRHPEYDESQVQWAVKRIMLGDELFAKAYPGITIKP
ncbi:MAG: hypothetical protein NTX50_09700 [Candidatus Sumerlaeota bacterium]|nr:hypothetical protein [Candidatus Sumerlaeota bacterium]